MFRFLAALSLLSLAFAGCSDSGPVAPTPGFPGANGNLDPLPGAIMSCYYGHGDNLPSATVEQVREVYQGQGVVHVRLTLDPHFVDNTYGAGSLDWGKKPHEFKSLVGSDHAQIQLNDGAGTLAYDVSMDYLSADASAPSGYASLGVTGGDGEVLTGNAADFLAIATSLDRNLNQRGYGSYLADSPVTDESYDPDPAAPNWDFRVVYEAWVADGAFAQNGLGVPTIQYIHASPSKCDGDTVVVEPQPCPPDWTPPGTCNNPDGCGGSANPPTTDPECTDDGDCPTGEFCNEHGTCGPVIL